MVSLDTLTNTQKVVKKKRACFDNLYKIILKKLTSNNGRMPNGYMSTFLEENRNSFDWLMSDIVNNAHLRFKKGRLEKSSVQGKPIINMINIDQPTNA